MNNNVLYDLADWLVQHQGSVSVTKEPGNEGDACRHKLEVAIRHPVEMRVEHFISQESIDAANFNVPGLALARAVRSLRDGIDSLEERPAGA